MKKLFCLLLIAMALCSLAACGREKDKGAAAADSADNQAPESSVSQKQPAEKKSESKPAASEPTQSTDGVDVDLTRLSSTMVYSEVYNMMNAPGDYIGKTIKMTGQFVYLLIDLTQHATRSARRDDRYRRSAGSRMDTAGKTTDPAIRRAGAISAAFRMGKRTKPLGTKSFSV